MDQVRRDQERSTYSSSCLIFFFSYWLLHMTVALPHTVAAYEIECCLPDVLKLEAVLYDVLFLSSRQLCSNCPVHWPNFNNNFFSLVHLMCNMKFMFVDCTVIIIGPRFN